MPKPKPFTYTKKEPFRKASLFVIICEGQSREPEYFRFFEGMSSRVRIIPVPSIDGKSSPIKLVANAIEKEEELGISPKDDQVWFAIDTDRWRAQIHELREEGKKHIHWQIAQSNPCFGVWLYFHAKSALPQIQNIIECKSWKTHLPKVMKNGIDLKNHPIAIETAIINSKAIYKETGYLPEVGGTQLWRLGEALMLLIKDEFDECKGIFSSPEILG